MSLNNLSKKLLALFAAVVVACGFATNAFAGDTTELIDAGTLEIDPAFSIDNIHDGKPSVSTELGIVYGVMDGLNITGTVGYGSAEGLAGGGVYFGIGALATPLDTDMIDLDVMLDFDWDGGYVLTPSVELNIDLEPDQAFLGFYIRLGLPIYGGYAPKPDDEEPEDAVKADVALNFTLGMYYTIMEGHQILLEGGATVAELAENLGKTHTDGFVSLGYNAQLTDNFELITELAVHMDNDADDVYATISVGGAFGMFGKQSKHSKSTNTISVLQNAFAPIVF